MNRTTRRERTLIGIGSLLVAAAGLAAHAQQAHDLVLAPHNVHWGYYDAALTPASSYTSQPR